MLLLQYENFHKQNERGKTLKIKLEVSKEKYIEIKEKMLSLGFEIDDDADFIFSERNCCLAYIACKKDDESHRLNTDEIIFIESMGHDVIIHTMQEEYKCSDRLWQLEKSLNPSKFLRISNSVIINRKKIKRIKSALGQKFLLTMENGSNVDVTRSYYYMFKNEFGI